MPAEEAQRLVVGRDVDDIQADRQVRDALLWNFTVLGEAAAQLSDEFKKAYPSVNWARPSQLRNRIVHGYWSVDLEILHALEFIEHAGIEQPAASEVGNPDARFIAFAMHQKIRRLQILVQHTDAVRGTDRIRGYHE